METMRRLPRPRRSYDNSDNEGDEGSDGAATQDQDAGGIDEPGGGPASLQALAAKRQALLVCRLIFMDAIMLVPPKQPPAIRMLPFCGRAALHHTLLRGLRCISLLLKIVGDVAQMLNVKGT